jgi:D-alanyl-D-alanine dipeptidase
MAILPCLTVSAAAASLPPGFVLLSDLAPSIRQDIRYAGSNNFTGRPVPGYAAGQCWLRQEAASALALAQVDALKQGLTLVVYDCYRPQRATRAFMEWARDEHDQIMKDRFYPAIEKRTLFSQGYISPQSSHSTGLAVDLAIDGLDFGTPFDFFDLRSSAGSKLVSAAAIKNRRKLQELMLHRGFSSYKREWWHFTFIGAQDPKPWDAEVK